MKQTATVKSIENNEAVVVVNRTSACDKCHREGACRECHMFDNEPSLTVTVRNDIQALPGDRVEIESGSGRILLYAFFTFFLPILLAVAGYLAATMLFPDSQAGLVAFFGMLILSFLFLKFVVERRAKQAEKPHITKILYEVPGAQS